MCICAWHFQEHNGYKWACSVRLKPIKIWSQAVLQVAIAITITAYAKPSERFTVVSHFFSTSQIWLTKISWISSRSGNTGRCISCYHPTCWWLTPLLLTSLTVSTTINCPFCSENSVCVFKKSPVCLGEALSQCCHEIHKAYINSLLYWDQLLDCWLVCIYD